MKLKRIYRPEVEIECKNRAIFYAACIVCWTKIGIKVGKIKVVLFDRVYRKYCLQNYRFLIIPKYHFKKAGAEDC